MSADHHQTFVYAGLAGEGEYIGAGGLYRYAAHNGEWQSLTNGLPEHPQVRALLMHPQNSAILYAGTHKGPYRSDDRGEHWTALEAPPQGTDVWSLAFHPHDANIIYAGYEPCAIYRSEDGGEHWKRMNTEKVRFPHITSYMPPLGKRVIGIAADPSDPHDMYAAIEVGGLLASRDEGESWESITDGLYVRNNTVDLHGVQVEPCGPRHGVHHHPGSHVPESPSRAALGACADRRDVPGRVILSWTVSGAKRSPHHLSGRRSGRWRGAEGHPGGRSPVSQS